MISYLKISIFSFLFCGYITVIFAQQSKIESFKTALKILKEDTNRVNTLNDLAAEFGSNNPDTAMILCNEALLLSQKLNWKKGEAMSEAKIGLFKWSKGKYEEALTHYNMALSICEALISSTDKEDVSAGKKMKGKALGNIALVYQNQGDFPKALDYYLKGLKIKEELGDKQGTARTLGNMANVYSDEGEFSKALDYYFKSLKIAEELGDKLQVGRILGNMAIVYKIQNNYLTALDYYYKSLKIAEELGDNRAIGYTLGNIGNIYQIQGDFSKSLDCHLKSLKVAEELGDKHSIASTLSNIGGLKQELGSYKEAEDYLKKALVISTEIEALDLQKQHQLMLSSLYEKTKKPTLAYEHYKKYIALRDTIFSEENTKKLMRSEMDHEYEKKQAIENTLHKSAMEKQQAMAEEKQRRQNLVIWSIAIGLLLVLVFAFFILKSLRTTNKQKQIIEIKSKETEVQKHLIEEKHKEITDSINYAERIQSSFLASKEMLDENLKDYFIFFKPKDIVSGDFYWSAKLSNGNFALVTADSTGHGVPGAIMSLLNTTSLESAIKDGFTKPSDILNSTRKTIIERLKKDGTAEGGKDGMDCSLTVYDFKNKKLIIAAANNPVWIVRGTETIEIKADKMPIGKHDKDSISFTQQEIQLQSGDVIYTLTDGFPDQFGGEKGKKFMSKNLRELLAVNAHLPMQEQKTVLESTFKKWVNHLEQVDDVTIIGVRV